MYGQLIFGKAGKNIQWKKVSLANGAGRTGQQHAEEKNFLTPYTKINSKWMKDLNVRQETIKTLEKKTGNNLFDLSHSNFFLDTPPKAREIKAKMNYWDLTKIKSFCTTKETINRTKRQLTEWEKIFANDISDKGLVSKIYKELIKLNTQKTSNPVKKWAENMNRHFSKEDIRVADRKSTRLNSSH